MKLLKQILKEMPADINIVNSPEDDVHNNTEDHSGPGFHSNIEKDTIENDNFRKVLYTTEKTQLVLMSLNPGEEIGEETHDGDQFFRFEEGEGKMVIDDDEFVVTDGFAVVVPEGALHNVINTSETEDLKLYAIYAPPQHETGKIDPIKEAE